MSTKASIIITGALQLIGALGAEETPENWQLQDGLRRLNLMMGSWSLQVLTQPVQSRDIFPITQNISAYAIGPGGTFDTTRPNAIAGISLVLNASTPPIEVPLAPLTDDAYQALTIKSQPNTQPTAFYYSPSFPLGVINLWPVPDNGLNSLAIYSRDPLASFGTLVADYQLPDGLGEALEYNLTKRLAPVYTRSVPADVARLARSSLSVFKRSNVRLTDVPQDPITSSPRAGYNIETGTGG